MNKSIKIDISCRDESYHTELNFVRGVYALGFVIRQSLVSTQRLDRIYHDRQILLANSLSKINQKSLGLSKIRSNVCGL